MQLHNLGMSSRPQCRSIFSSVHCAVRMSTHMRTIILVLCIRFNIRTYGPSVRIFCIIYIDLLDFIISQKLFNWIFSSTCAIFWLNQASACHPYLRVKRIGILFYTPNSWNCFRGCFWNNINLETYTYFVYLLAVIAENPYVNSFGLSIYQSA